MASATAAVSRGEMITRDELKLRYSLSKDQVEAWEEAGLPVYGLGHARFYYVDEVEAFIRERPIRRKVR